MEVTMQIITRSVKNCAISMFTLCLLLAISLPLFAADTEFKSVSTEVLKEMLDGKKEFTLIDARTKEEYQEAHIGKSVNITEKDFDKLAATLPSDKGELLVLYCNGIKCGKSKKVAAKATEAGYRNLLIYGEGFPVWEEKGMPIVAGPDYAKKIVTTKLSPAELEKLLREKKDAYVLVDVRDEFEFAEGHIAGAINIPAETFAVKSGVLPKDKGIIVYCNSGGRSYMAYRKLMKLAYPTIFQTTFAVWKEAGFPVVKSQL
jgi:rhodanese-related sulfurtransferase